MVLGEEGKCYNVTRLERDKYSVSNEMFTNWKERIKSLNHEVLAIQLK